MTDNRPTDGDAADDPRDPRLAALYREASDDQPPANLEADIRAAARRGVGAGPRPVDPTSMRAWRVPMAVAAVLVLSVSVVTLMREEDPGRFAEPLRGARPPAARPPATASQKEAPSEPAASAQPGTGAAQPESRARAPAGETGQQPAQTLRSLPAPPDPGASTAQRPADAAAERGRQETAPPAAMAPSPADAPAEHASGRDSAAKPAAAMTEQEQASRAPTAVMPAPAARSAPGKSALATAYANEPPQKWLEKIADLRREGRQAEADELLEVFRQRFPDHPLPAGWR